MCRAIAFLEHLAGRYYIHRYVGAYGCMSEHGVWLTMFGVTQHLKVCLTLIFHLSAVGSEELCKAFLHIADCIIIVFIDTFHCTTVPYSGAFWNGVHCMETSNECVVSTGRYAAGVMCDIVECVHR